MFVAYWLTHGNYDTMKVLTLATHPKACLGRHCNIHSQVAFSKNPRRMMTLFNQTKVCCLGNVYSTGVISLLIRLFAVSWADLSASLISVAFHILV